MEISKSTSPRDWRTIIALVLMVLLAAIVVVLFFTKGSPTASEKNSGTPVTPSPGATNTVSRSLVPSFTPYSRTSTPETIEPTFTQTPLALPESHYLKIAADRQYFALGCEASAAVDLAEYYDILIYQYNFQHEIGRAHV